MRTRNILRAAAGLLIGAALAASPAAAQLGNASATTLGLAGNATATARGLAALSVNPAGLGMPGSGFSLALVPVQVRSGIDPITLKDLKDVEGTVLSREMKEDWLARATQAGGQTGEVGADATILAVTFGKVGFQATTLVAGDVDVSPDVLQILLYGNAGRTGNPANISLQGSAVNGFAITTGGLSVGIPLSSAAGSMAVGATIKYSVGNVVLVGRDQGGQITSDPVKVDLHFPVIMPQEDQNLFSNNGSGVGLDLGFQAQRGKAYFAAALLNAFNTFKWNTDGLVYRPVAVLFDGDNSNSDADEQPVANAPSVLKTAIEDMKFDPILSAGVGYDVTPDFTVSADFRNRLGEGMSVTPKMHLGAGAEFRGLKVLHVRGGASLITNGIELAGGASLILGPVNLSFAGGLRSGDLADTTMYQLTLSFGGR